MWAMRNSDSWWESLPQELKDDCVDVRDIVRDMMMSALGKRTIVEERKAMERRNIESSIAKVQVEERADGKAGIRGYAAVFYDGTPETEFTLWDGAVERIMPGAFDRAVKEDDVRALANHNPDRLLGRTKSGTLTLSVDKKGLHYDIDLPDNHVGQGVAEDIRRRDLDGSSFMFRATDEKWEKEDDIEVRKIEGVELFDVGPVTFPAYVATSADSREAREAYERQHAQDREGRKRKLQVQARAAVAKVAALAA